MSTEKKANFPTETLPSVVKDFVGEAAINLPCSPEMVTLPVLVTLGAAIGNSRRIRIKQGWEQPSALYGAIVAETGTKKSPALKQAIGPILAVQTQTRRTWTSDATVERLAQLLQENPRGLLIYKDELTGLARGMNQYKGGKGDDREFYLSAYDGSSASIDRKKSATANSSTPLHIAIERPHLSIVGCIPPAMLPVLKQGFSMEDGFLQRMLFAMPEAVPVRLTKAVVSTELQTDYDALVRRLSSLDGQAGQPIILELTPDAWRAFQQWHDHLAEEMESGGVPSMLKGFYSKHWGQCARLALIHAVTSNADAEVIPQESVHAAIAQIEYFKAQLGDVVKALSVGVGNVGTQGMDLWKCREEILRRFQGGKSESKRDVQRATNCKGNFRLAWESLTQGPTLEADENGLFRLTEAIINTFEQEKRQSHVVTDIPTTDRAA